MPIKVFDFSNMSKDLTPAESASSDAAAGSELRTRQEHNNSLKFKYRIHAKQPTVTLNNGRDMPRMGLGTW